MGETRKFRATWVLSNELEQQRLAKALIWFTLCTNNCRYFSRIIKLFDDQTFTRYFSQRLLDLRRKDPSFIRSDQN